MDTFGAIYLFTKNNPMKKRITFFPSGPARPLAAALFITIYILSGSSSAQEVIAPAGGEYRTEGASISWTLGEGAIETFSAGSYILTQGFHQPTLTVVSVNELSDPDFAIKVFPNPADDYFSLYIGHEQPGDFRYLLGDIQGTPILNDRVHSHESRIQVSSLPRGFYLLSVIYDKKVVKTINIIKR